MGVRFLRLEWGYKTSKERFREKQFTKNDRKPTCIIKTSGNFSALWRDNDDTSESCLVILKGREKNREGKKRIPAKPTWWCISPWGAYSSLTLCLHLPGWGFGWFCHCLVTSSLASAAKHVSWALACAGLRELSSLFLEVLDVCTQIMIEGFLSNLIL